MPQVHECASCKKAFLCSTYQLLEHWEKCHRKVTLTKDVKVNVPPSSLGPNTSDFRVLPNLAVGKPEAKRVFEATFQPLLQVLPSIAEKEG